MQYTFCAIALGEKNPAPRNEQTINEMPRVSLLTTNMAHASLHYGNLVTYMRMKGIVPPSSEPGFGRRK